MGPKDFGLAFADIAQAVVTAAAEGGLSVSYENDSGHLDHVLPNRMGDRRRMQESEKEGPAAGHVSNIRLEISLLVCILRAVSWPCQEKKERTLAFILIHANTPATLDIRPHEHKG
ncbi:hypothetical protein DSLASN_35770 [Desulfoluna limicola]|uniref:Uncharacterized protein n=1 Tax=Desulfoluna limicola TaxID=2810562 RepID=A0ABM7PKK2_9BACT|nr:hypothetical protein DSLASN_35770 [Desulfoluna limicola]